MASVLDAEVVDELMSEWGTEVGQRLRKRRQSLKMTLDQVAGLAGVSRQTIHRAEYDGTTVRDGTRQAIAVALAAEVAEIWAPLSAAEMRNRAKTVT